MTNNPLKQAMVNDNMKNLFNLPDATIPNPVEQGKVWSELSNTQADNLDDLMLNKLTVELIINQNKDE